MRARRAIFFARRAVAALIVLAIIWVVGSVAYVVVKEPLGGSILLLLLALMGGLLFLLWAVYKVFSGIVRFVAGSSTQARTQGLGANYEEMVRAQQSQGAQAQTGEDAEARKLRKFGLIE